MGTRSRIGMATEAGQFRSIYCHFDGYPDHNGKILLDHYTEREKVVKLISLGDLSSLAAEIGEKHDFNCRPTEQCNFYGRDRDEEDVETLVSPDFTSLYRACRDCNAEWLYVWTKDGWLFGEVSREEKTLAALNKLTPEAIEASSILD